MIKIDFLQNHPNAIPRLAQIWHELIGRIWTPNIMMTEVEAWMHEWNNQDALPLAYVAFNDNIPVGSCSLQVNDGIRPDLTPWLGDLCVDPAYQKLGIGQLLIDSTKESAKHLCYNKLYLFAFDTASASYYEQLGWQKIGMDEFKGHPVTVMEITL